MKIGLNLDNRGPAATPGRMIRFAQTADRLGFSSLGVSDHVVLVRQQTLDYPFSATGEIDFEAWTPWNDTLGLISYVAGKTERIRIGPSVLILPYRNPLVTAKWFATVDSLSDGRLFLGAGTGWWREEFEALGLGGQFGERGPRTDEYLRIFRNLWTAETPEFEGRFHRFSNLIASPKPVQPAGPPIWIGGNTRRALRRVAELGDLWHPVVLTPPDNLDLATLGERRGDLATLFEQYGRDPSTVRIVPKTHLHWHEQSGRPLTGSPGKIIDDMRSYEKVGAEELILYVPGENETETLESLHRIAEEVMPHVA